MAASAWVVFDRAKHKVGDGTIDLSGGSFRMSLHRTSASANLVGNITIMTSVADEVTGGGYAELALSGIAWTDGASAGEQKYDCTDPVFTASNSNIVNVRYAVIFASGASAGAEHLLCYAALSTAQFDVTGGNTLTVQMASTGIFVLS